MTTTASPFASEARVTTEMASRYLGQLCKHFEHKLPVTYEGQHGTIAFSAGACILDAVDANTLILRVEAGDETALPGLQDVVARHLERFAFRDKPEIVWTRVGAASGQS